MKTTRIRQAIVIAFILCLFASSFWAPGEITFVTMAKKNEEGGLTYTKSEFLIPLKTAYAPIWSPPYEPGNHARLMIESVLGIWGSLIAIVWGLDRLVVLQFSSRGIHSHADSA